MSDYSQPIEWERIIATCHGNEASALIFLQCIEQTYFSQEQKHLMALPPQERLNRIHWLFANLGINRTVNVPLIRRCE